jgi:hypothetical protein
VFIPALGSDPKNVGPRWHTDRRGEHVQKTRRRKARHFGEVGEREFVAVSQMTSNVAQHPVHAEVDRLGVPAVEHLLRESGLDTHLVDHFVAKCSAPPCDLPRRNAGDVG